MTNSPASIHQYPILPPAFNTRSVKGQRFFQLHDPNSRKSSKQKPPEPNLEIDINMATASTSGTAGTTSTTPPPPSLANDHTFAPAPFTGRSKEDAQTWLSYADRYMTYKAMTAEGKLNFFKLLLREGAADWMDSLSEADRNSLDNLTQKFKQRFITSDLIKWHKANDVFETAQNQGETVDDYVTRIRKLGKTIPLDDNVVRYAIIKGFRPHIKTHVVLVNPTTMERMLEAARAAELTEHTQFPGVEQLADEVRQSRQQLESQMKLISQKVDNMTVHTIAPRAPSPKRVTFAENTRVGQKKYSPQNQRRFQPNSFQQNSQMKNFCSNCGRYHAQRECKAYESTCFLCGRKGHFQAMCRSGRRQNQGYSSYPKYQANQTSQYQPQQ